LFCFERDERKSERATPAGDDSDGVGFIVSHARAQAAPPPPLITHLLPLVRVLGAAAPHARRAVLGPGRDHVGTRGREGEVEDARRVAPPERGVVDVARRHVCCALLSDVTPVESGDRCLCV
jgi:hypothetical protein